MADIVKDRLRFLDVFNRRSDIQLLAAFVHLLWMDKGLSNADCIGIAENELYAMAATDDIVQEETEEEAARELRIAHLMAKVCKTKQ